MVIPIVKKGEGKRVEDYKEVTIMSTLYKVYKKLYKVWRKD